MLESGRLPRGRPLSFWGARLYSSCMKKFALVVLFSSALSAFAETVIQHPILTEDLRDPPRLEECIRKILGPLKVRYFQGPYQARPSNVAEYRVVTESGELRMQFEATSGQDWRYFTYPGPQGATAIGMWANGLNTRSTLIDHSTGTIAYEIDLTPCARFLGRQ